MSIFQRGATYYLKTRIAGRQVLRSLDTRDKIEAMARAAELLRGMSSATDTSTDTTTDTTAAAVSAPVASGWRKVGECYGKVIKAIEDGVSRGHVRPSYELDSKGLWSRHLQRFQARLVDAALDKTVIAYLDRQSLSVARRRKAHTLFRRIATEAGVTLKPHRFTTVEAPRRKQPLTADQLAAVKRECLLYPHPMARLIYLAAVTGARIGEIAGLEPADIGPQHIHITKTRCRRTGKLLLAKTRRSQRIVPVAPDVLDIARPAIGQCTRDWFPVWRVIRKRAGIGAVGIHVLRHTWATHALGAKVTPKAVSLALGHFSVAFTEAQYAPFLTTEVFKDELLSFNS